MKFQDDQSGAGFYESFSDIIFATMAIFVLLMVIFLVLAHETNAEKMAQKKLERLQEETQQISQQTDETQKKSKQIEEDLKQLSKRRVEIAIAVDKTGSMEDELYNLKHAIQQMSQILPKIMDSVRISVVAYRFDEYDKNNTETFPMTTILDKNKDGGSSLKKLNNFMAKQTHLGGTAPVLQATQTALKQFNTNAEETDHQVFMLLGDVGPYEIPPYNQADKMTQEGLRRAQELVSVIKQWSSQKKHRNIIVLFSGRDEMNDFRYGGERQLKHKRSMELFKKIAQEAGQPEAYTENQSKMLVDFLVAALKRK